MESKIKLKACVFQFRQLVPGCLAFLFTLLLSCSSANDRENTTESITADVAIADTTDYIKASQELLYAVRTDEAEEVELYSKQLEKATKAGLKNQLKSDDEKKAFWLNIYNSFVQLRLKEDASLYKDQKQFYNTDYIEIAGYKMSLDFIEHALLRGDVNKSKAKIPSDIVAVFKVKQLDNRIHFALNCGAASCPPIAFYEPQGIDKQLQMATESYLNIEVSYNKATNTVEVPKIFDWFKEDFKGETGIIQLLQQAGAIPQGVSPHIRYKEYDWTLELNKFKG